MKISCLGWKRYPISLWAPQGILLVLKIQPWMSRNSPFSKKYLLVVSSTQGTLNTLSLDPHKSSVLKILLIRTLEKTK